MGNTDSGKIKVTTGEASAGKNAARSGSFRIAQEPVVQGHGVEDGHKFEVSQERDVPAPAFQHLGELPASYGANAIFLIARDPQWLFTYWDVDWKAFPASSMKDGERKIFLKVFNASGGEGQLIQINPEARNWYLPVERAGEEYWIELGYFDSTGEWTVIAQSPHTRTPAMGVAEEHGGVDFATVPMHLTFQRLLEMVKTAMQSGESLLEALSRLQDEGARLAFEPGKTPNWTEDQKRLLAALLGEEVVSRLAMGSGEIDQLLRRQLMEKLNTESASELSVKGRLAELLGSTESSLFSGLFANLSSGLSSGLGASWSGQPFSVPRNFFMHVNAEVIFYGGTHPDAKVTIDGDPIQLKPDGTFRYHFRFPDGSFNVPIVAVSPDGVETRSAELKFERSTRKVGDVDDTSQPGYLPAEPMGRQS